MRSRRESGNPLPTAPRSKQDRLQPVAFRPQRNVVGDKLTSVPQVTAGRIPIIREGAKSGRAVLIALTFAVLSAVAQQVTQKPAPAPAPKRDLSGLWHYQGTGGSEPIAPDNLIPPMT